MFGDIKGRTKIKFTTGIETSAWVKGDGKVFTGLEFQSSKVKSCELA